MRIWKGEQGTNEWLAFREQGLGSTDMASIMGMNPYKTALEVYYDKVGLGTPVKDNIFMQKGREEEPKILKQYNNENFSEFKPVCVIHEDFDYLRGSLDGYDNRFKENSILEIKYSMYPKMTNCFLKQDIEIFKTIYPQYYVQVQWFAFLTDSSNINIVTRNVYDDSLLSLKIDRDETLIQEMFSKAKHFWENHVLKLCPPDSETVEIVKLNDSRAIELAKKLEEAQDKLKELKALESSLRQEIIDLSNDGDFQVNNLKFTRVAPRPTLDKKGLYAKFNITSEDEKEFTVLKEGAGSYRVTKIKG